MNNPVDSKDTTPLWGGAQYNYPEHARAEPSTSWGGDLPSHPTAHHHSFDPYHGLREDINYTELKPDHGPTTMGEPENSILPDSYPRAMGYIQQQQHQHQHYQQQHLAGGGPPIPQGGYLPSLLPHSPFLNGNNTLLSENPPYLQSLAAFQENRSSPDLGYSSPPPAPEYFGTHHHYQHRGQVAGAAGAAGEFSMASYHQNVMSSGEPPMGHVPVKQEASDASAVSYSKQLELIVKHVDDNKPIIHANIQICPPYKFGPSSSSSQMQMQNSYPQQQQQGMQPEPFAVNISLPQPSPQNSTSAGGHVQNTPGYELMELDAAQSGKAAKPTPKKSPARAKKSPPKNTLKPNDRRSVRPSAIRDSEFQCLKCGEFFARKCGLTQHDKWIHTKRDHQCTWCGKFFATKEQLEKHEVRHEKVDKPFKCDQCPKQYCHKNDLRRHMYRHDEASPHACTLCSNVFVRADHLSSHIATHERRERMAAEREAAAALKPKSAAKPKKGAKKD